jgi:hypothetical protein
VGVLQQRPRGIRHQERKGVDPPAQIAITLMEIPEPSYEWDFSLSRYSGRWE